MTTLNHDQLQLAVKQAKDHFDQIGQDNPQLKGYLVFSMAGQQTGIGSSPDTILKEIPLMVVEDQATTALRLHIKDKPDKDAKDKVKQTWQKTLSKLGSALSYHSHILIEIRFRNLDYELIGQLQVHPLVDRQLTMQSRASIRIVMGTLQDLLAH